MVVIIYIVWKSIDRVQVRLDIMFLLDKYIVLFILIVKAVKGYYYTLVVEYRIMY